jgi:hypothetical protein
MVFAFCPLAFDLNRKLAATPIPITSLLEKGPQGGNDDVSIPSSCWVAKNLFPSSRFEYTVDLSRNQKLSRFALRMQHNRRTSQGLSRLGNLP